MDPITLSIAAAIAALAVIGALVVACWTVKIAIKMLMNILEKIKARSAVVRKRKALKKFIDLAKKCDNLEVAAELQKIKDNHQALLTPLDDNGNEDWEKLRIVKPESEEDDLIDGFMVADTSRVAAI